MHEMSAKEKRILEIMLIVICVGIASLFYAMYGYRMVILNLFFLPIALAGFFLGRYRAGLMSLFCIIAISMVTMSRLVDLSAATSPLVIALAVAAWGAVLGLTALLTGSLSDERSNKVKELHEAYVGVVEVLSQYLQSGDPRVTARSVRVAELSQNVAVAMKIPPRAIDDIRVAALLYEVGNLEVTTRVIRRAISKCGEQTQSTQKHTFQGMDLMLSLSTVLSGAVPLLLNQHENASTREMKDRTDSPADAPIGAQIIRLVRDFVTLEQGVGGGPRLTPAEILKTLRRDRASGDDAEILTALEHVIGQPDRTSLPLMTRTPSPPLDVPTESGLS